MRGRPKLLKTINLKEGMPLVREAVARLQRELRLARSEGLPLVKIVHGYGSTGKGGEIRLAVQAELTRALQRGELRGVIFGEEWRISNEACWHLLKRWPELKQDKDLGRENLGITVVML